MGKPGTKWKLIFSIVMDVVLSVVLSISGTLLAHQKLVFFPNLVSSIALCFVIAFLVSTIIPIPKVSVGFAGLLHIKPHTMAEKLVGNIPVSLLFTVIAGGALTFFNLYMAKHVELFPRVFLGSFLPMFAIVFVVTFCMTPIAAAVANSACRR